MALPTTRLGNLTVTRLMLGGNPISGFSHAGSERSKAMVDYFTAENVKALFRRCEDAGITTAVLRGDKHIMRLLTEYWNEGGRLQWIAQTAPEYQPMTNVNHIVGFGAKAAYLHGGAIDDAFADGDLDGPKRQFDAIRERGLPVGCASHVPDNVRRIVELGWDPDFFCICLYNIPGYRGQLSPSQDEKFVEGDRAKALALFKEIDKPCIAYKILGAGRCDPRESFEEVCAHIKPIDCINLGMYPPDNPQMIEQNVRLAEELLPR